MADDGYKLDVDKAEAPGTQQSGMGGIEPVPQPGVSPGHSEPMMEVAPQVPVAPQAQSGAGVMRPWQGTTLGVLSIIGTVRLGLMIMMLVMTMFGMTAMLSNLPGFYVVGELAGDPGVFGGLLAGLGAMLLVPAVGIFVLEIFVIRGIFKGRKWTIILTMVLSILSMLSAFKEFAIFLIALNGFFLWIEYVCLNHPFYAKKDVVAG